MSMRDTANRALPLALVAAVGCGPQNLTDSFGGPVDAASFDAAHSPTTDGNDDGVLESLTPREGYIDGKVVQFYELGEIPLATDADGAPLVDGAGNFVTRPNRVYRFVAGCEGAAGKQKLSFDSAPQFDFDPRGLQGDLFSPFLQHDILEFLPDGSGSYNPIMQVFEVTPSRGFVCNEIQNHETIRVRFASEDINSNGILDIADGEDIDGDAALDGDLGGDLGVPSATGNFVLLEGFDVSTRLPDLIASPAIDPTSQNGSNLNFVFFDPDGDGILGGIPAYLDQFNTFFKAHLLHTIEFRPPTVGDAGIDADDDGSPDDNLKTFTTMRMFVDVDEPEARPIFEFAPGDPSFQPIVQVVTFKRPAGTLPGEINNVAEILQNVPAADIVETESFVHAAFAIVGVDDPRQTGTSVFFLDTDLDGITDTIEALLGSNPNDEDSDNDGIDDGAEDRNRDGLIEAFESDPTSVDGDEDGISDAIERNAGLDANNVDTDNDGIPDGVEDANQNGVVDANETNPLNNDTDGDGLADGVEDANKNGAVNNGETDPREENTDGDCLSDGEEATIGSDALDINSPVQFVPGSCN